MTDNGTLGATARAVEPLVRHAFVGSRFGDDTDAFERKLYVVRKRFEKAIVDAGLDDHTFYFSSLSCRTLVYKGMLTPEQVIDYYADDLGDDRLVSALCMFHSRFSTNTFPSWQLAHPYRMIAHNGEINTLRGNLNWMRRARRSSPRRSTRKATWRSSSRSSSRGSPTPRASTPRSSCSSSPATACRTR